MPKRFVNWFEESLQKFYGHDNQGYVHGIYYYDDPDNFPIHVEWYQTEKERANAYQN